MTHTILIAGATGFIGKNLNRSLQDQGYKKCGLERLGIPLDILRIMRCQAFENKYKFQEPLTNNIVDVICCAGIHDRGPLGQWSLKILIKVNCTQVLKFAQLCALVGVRKFIFLSSQKAALFSFVETNSEFEKSIRASQRYGYSKWLAEKSLLNEFQSKRIQIIILRLPVVYGIGVQGNFKKMVFFVSKPIPLLVPKLSFKKSFLGIPNLLSCIFYCLDRKRIMDDVYDISDEDDKTLDEVLIDMGAAFHKKKLLLHLPNWFFKVVLYLIGKKDFYEKISLTPNYHGEKGIKKIDWEPNYSFKENINNIKDW